MSLGPLAFLEAPWFPTTPNPAHSPRSQSSYPILPTYLGRQHQWLKVLVLQQMDLGSNSDFDTH